MHFTHKNQCSLSSFSQNKLCGLSSVESPEIPVNADSYIP